MQNIDYENGWIAAEGTGTINGYIVDSNITCRKEVRIRPAEHYYHPKGGKPSIKWGCPVCDILGNRHTVHFGDDGCILCGIRFAWDGYTVKEMDDHVS